MVVLTFAVTAWKRMNSRRKKSRLRKKEDRYRRKRKRDWDTDRAKSMPLFPFNELYILYPRDAPLKWRRIVAASKNDVYNIPTVVFFFLSLSDRPTDRFNSNFNSTRKKVYLFFPAEKKRVNFAHQRNFKESSMQVRDIYRRNLAKPWNLSNWRRKTDMHTHSQTTNFGWFLWKKYKSLVLSTTLINIEWIDCWFWKLRLHIFWSIDLIVTKN